MELTFDLAQDELPIFLAETDEQMQVLDEGLIRLEREGEDVQLLQDIFRAAHTLKGTSGMIGHKRMVALTHALENVFDCLRKQQLPVTTSLIDLCLEAVDALRRLREEVVTGKMSDVDIEGLTERFKEFGTSPKTEGGEQNASIKSPSQSVERSSEVSQSVNNFDGQKTQMFFVQGDIAHDSVASAARAFQIMLVLQSLGTIIKMYPSLSEIETSHPVFRFLAHFQTTHPISEIQKELDLISELTRVLVEPLEKHPEWPADAISPSQPAERSTDISRPIAHVESQKNQLYFVQGDIAHDSVASAARAFQIMLALQGMGTIIKMYPSLSEIETSHPVFRFLAHFQTAHPISEIQKELDLISELTRVFVEPLEKHPEWPTDVKSPVQAARPPASDKPITPLPKDENEKAATQPAQLKITAEKTVRTSVERLDNLMNLVGELITDRNRLYQIRSNLDATIRNNNQADVLAETITHIGRITDQLQLEVMGIRMLPISNVFNKFPRMVRDLSNKMGKKIDLVIQGENTELDRSVIEEISDPLIHLLRNSVDHGIERPEDRIKAGKPERGTVTLSAYHEQGRIVLIVEDDGAGIDCERLKQTAVTKGILTEVDAATMDDEEAVNLIFSSGLSTAKALSDVSGRGVGMDIVRANIQKLNGSISTETQRGKGTKFQVSMPLTLAIVPTMLVTVGENILAIPLVTVVETLRMSPEDIQTVNNRPVIVLRNRVLPLMSVADAFNLTSRSKDEGYQYAVVVSQGKLQIGLLVDRLLGQEEVVVKSLGALIGDVLGIASAAILGDGQVILIVDVQDLFQIAGLRRTGSV